MSTRYKLMSVLINRPISVSKMVTDLSKEQGVNKKNINIKEVIGYELYDNKLGKVLILDKREATSRVMNGGCENAIPKVYRIGAGTLYTLVSKNRGLNTKNKIFKSVYSSDGKILDKYKFLFQD